MNSNTGCLVIHGFGGSIDEISPLAKHLKGEGYHVICPVLKGHTGKRRDLRGISYKEWICSAEESLKELLGKCDKVYLIGFSMGGLIALNLATRYQVEGVVTLNSPIYYWDLKRIVLNIIGDIQQRKPENIKRYLKSGGSFPISALLNFRILLDRSKQLIKEVVCPVLITQALEDDTVRKSSAGYIYETVASKQKSIKYYENSGHLILWSQASDCVIRDIQSFLYETKKFNLERL